MGGQTSTGTGGEGAGGNVASPVVDITVGKAHSCARLQNGEAHCWGENEDGQLGDGTEIDRTNPTDIGIAVSDLDAGFSHTCAVQEGGDVLCWGSNTDGQLGVDPGNSTKLASPTKVPGLAGATSVCAGVSHSCAVLADGTIRCWGDNVWGQLGNASNTSSFVPVQVSGISEGRDISCGAQHTCVVLTNGFARCWGANVQLGVPGAGGQLGDGTTTSSSVPVSVLSFAQAQGLSVGGAHACATELGQLRCWGINDDGQLGDGTTDDRSSPTTIAFSDTLSVGAGERHTCAASAGQVACWGANDSNQLGSAGGTSLSPIPVGSLGGAQRVVAGGGHTCALRTDGSVVCWGLNASGQLGNGSTTSAVTPVPVVGL